VKHLLVLLPFFIVTLGAVEPVGSVPLVPVDKHLDPAWVASLTARGEPTVLRGKELTYVGMPVSGQFTGHVYLGGDGTLWLWDIFNQKRYTTDKNGNHYEKPPLPEQPFRQGFDLCINGRTASLDQHGFSAIAFRGTYPIGTVDYRDPAVPLAVRLEAFSPFIPMDSQESGLPAIICRYTLTNPTSAPVTATLRGFLDNPVSLIHRQKLSGQRRNRILAGSGFTALECSAVPEQTPVPAELASDLGTFCLVLLDGPADPQTAQESTAPLVDPLPGSLARTVTVPPNGAVILDFALTWNFPNLSNIPKITNQGRYYASRFPDATAVAAHLAQHRDRLIRDTIAWRDTWYDSTLPYWFLDRTLHNISTLATSTSHRFRNGRQWAWEGVGNCAGTCGHVYYYGQAVGRLFPDLEREQREQVDFATSMRPDGAICFRGENNRGPAIDAQSGYILRALREHRMSRDDAFLRRIWPAVKKATGWLIAQDGNGDGLIEGAQHNTLDTDWYGASSWLSGIYQAALLASAAMADDLEDKDFATTCRNIAATGQRLLVHDLFNGEYFQNRVDPARANTVNSGSGCFIDQVLGQSWAFQAGLPRVFPERETRSALSALWRYNFTPDVGPYRAVNKPGRWYAMPGEAGLLMCTFPKPDWDMQKATGVGKGAWAAMYFNECMNGFEHQVAGHMLWEGMVEQGLAIERAIHDRYGAAKRNPWNEIECGDHYGRSMASYGVFIAACGFTCDGPHGDLGFAPRIHPEDFRAAFTAPEGWGTFAQKRSPSSLEASLAIRYGQLSLHRLHLSLDPAHHPTQATATLNGQPLSATLELAADGTVTVSLAQRTLIPTQGVLLVSIR
jgi:non-lysosomal glucosylceramidase